MKDAYYFPHDSNAQHDEKILQLRSGHGWQGYGIYWAIIEKLRESREYKFSISAVPGLALSLSHPQAELQALLDDCYNVGLLTKNGEYFHSESLTRRMREIDTRRESLREFGRRGGIASSQAQAKLKPPSSSKVKESKVKESKGMPTSKTLYLDSVLLSQGEFLKLEKQYGKEGAAARIEELNLGIMSKGYKYKSHYHTILSWERRKEKSATNTKRPPGLTPEQMKAAH